MTRPTESDRLVEFVFDTDLIAPKDRIHASEGHKLKCCGVNPGKATLRRWMCVGLRGVLLPSDRNPKLYTTVDAYRWWRARIKLLDSRKAP